MRRVLTDSEHTKMKAVARALSKSVKTHAEPMKLNWVANYFAPWCTGECPAQQCVNERSAPEQHVVPQSTDEGTAIKSGLGTSPKLFFITSPCYQVQHGGYN